MNNKKILVVDDQVPWQRILKEILEKEGFEVKLASNLKDAEDSLKSNNFDLATLDVRLEDNEFYNVEGLAILEQIKLNYPTLKTIVLTGYPDAIRNLEHIESDEIFFKSPEQGLFDIEDFVKIIKKLL